MFLIYIFEALMAGSKSELRGWNFQGTMVLFQIASWARAIAPWTIVLLAANVSFCFITFGVAVDVGNRVACTLAALMFV